MFPLQPGDQILFTDGARAEQFRRQSGNDGYGQGAGVKITRPTLVQCQ